jgi:iron complex transport system ATP-binding protein
MPTLIETEELSVAISGRKVCENLNVTIAAAQCWGILGRNGVGKTTLLHTLAGLRPPTVGRVLLERAELRRRPRRDVAQRIGVLFQNQADPFAMTVQETALLGRHPHLRPWQWEGKEDYAKMQQALEAVGMTELAERRASNLSGGERQRLAIATLLTQDPALFLLDEPVNHLDLYYQITVLKLLLKQVQERCKAMVLVLHDVNLAARFCDHLLLLFGDGFTLQGTMDMLLNEENLHRLYGHPLFAVLTPHGNAYLPA